jgi:hypothetical protein
MDLRFLFNVWPPADVGVLITTEAATGTPGKVLSLVRR